jgi:hypothetical protein
VNALLAETIDKKDVQAVIAVYRDLRKNDLGSGKYDFGETSLNILTENLLKQDARKPGPSWSSTSKSTPRLRVGPTAFWQCPTWQTRKWIKAKADYQKILELNPRDEREKNSLSN